MSSRLVYSTRGGDLVSAEDARGLLLAALIAQDGGLVLEGGQGDGVHGGQGAVLRHHGQEGVPPDQDGVESPGHGGVGKSEVDLIAHQHGGDPGIVVLPDLDAYVGIHGLELLQNGGQDVAGYAGKRADADVADLQALELGGLLVHGLGRVAELLDIGQDLRALGGEHHAELAAVQQRHRQLVLQGVDDLADGGLRIIAVHGGL